MTKFRLQISVLAFLFFCTFSHAQNNYRLFVRSVDKDSAFIASHFSITTTFPSIFACAEYVGKMQNEIRSKGYVTASVDSVRYDSAFARMVLFVGEIYRWVNLDAKSIDHSILDAVGWREKIFSNKPIDFSQIKLWEERILNFLEDNGHPFARVYLDSLQVNDEKVSAILKVNEGPLYKIDSIRVFGNAKISNDYLQRYLEIRNNSLYSKEKLLRISKKIRELPYIQEERPSNITMLLTGSVVNLYLRQKRSSQVNALIGFAPNNDQLSSKKLLVTGEANLNLKNALGSGETIGLNWQQLQVHSPRLNIIYQHPYLFHSPLGLDFAFDMFRKDSIYLNVNLQLGAQYILSTNQAGKIFVQRFQTIVNGINTAEVLQTRQLPAQADVSSFNVGVDYEFNNTDYRPNPRKGNEFHIITAIGSKQIKRNNTILELKDPNDSTFDFGTLYDTVKLKTFQLRVRATEEKYFPIGKQSTVKAAMNAGYYQSGNIFQNELFQIGGYKLLRGFDEESQYLSQFAIATLEYHYLIGINSYFYVLADGGWGRNNSQKNNFNYGYFGTGLGLAFETKAGIFNLAWAVGKRNDSQLNLRQSKIHIGFVNYF